MLAVLSPAKKLNEKIAKVNGNFTLPVFLQQASVLVEILRQFTPEQLGQLMDINSSLAELNFQRYQQWHLPFTPENAIPAIRLFHGEVYHGLKAETLSADDLLHAQNSLLILSGLYGVLRPLDLIQPYRLEMGTRLKNPAGDNLYVFWTDLVTRFINEELARTNSKYLINLASDEYFSVIHTDQIKATIITPQFKDFSGGTYKFLTVYGKKARGMMARFMITRRVTDIDELRLFNEEGYVFNPSLSTETSWVFTRG